MHMIKICNTEHCTSGWLNTNPSLSSWGVYLSLWIEPGAPNQLIRATGQLQCLPTHAPSLKPHPGGSNLPRSRVLLLPEAGLVHRDSGRAWINSLSFQGVSWQDNLQFWRKHLQYCHCHFYFIKWKVPRHVDLPNKERINIFTPHSMFQWQVTMFLCALCKLCFIS